MYIHHQDNQTFEKITNKKKIIIIDSGAGRVISGQKNMQMNAVVTTMKYLMPGKRRMYILKIYRFFYITFIIL